MWEINKIKINANQKNSDKREEKKEDKLFW